MNEIPRFEKRFNKAIEDHVFNLAKELFTEGFTEIDVLENINAHPLFPDPEKVQLRNYMRDIEVMWKNREPIKPRR
jgi:hypothetical protein